MLQKSGGSFNLTADAEFGSTYGLVSGYFKSASSNIAGSGAVRLSNTDSIAFRNADNSGDMLLSSDGTTDGILNYNSVPLVTLSAVQTLTAKTLTSPKLNEDVALTATSTYLNRVDVTSSIQTQLDAKQATISISSRLSADLIHDGSVSNTEFGYLAAVTSDIQTQLDAKQATISTTARLNANLVHDGTVSNTEFGYINTLSSNAQTQLNAKQATIDSTARLNADLIHDGSVSNTEFGHISTLSSNAQDQIDSKAPISNPNFTGYQDFNTISAPGAPGTTGQTRVYSTDGKLFFHGNGGAETEIGAGGGGVGSIDTLFTIQAKSAETASDASGDDYCFRGATAAITSAPTQDTTAGRLIHDEKVFKYASATNSTNDWWLYSKSVAQGYQGKNVVIQLQYYMMETTDDNLNNAFRFVARDATNGKVTQLNGAVSSSNTLTLDAFADGDFTVGDRVTFVDTSNNIIFRYITSVTHASEQLTISGAAVSIADNAYFVSGILTDELDYLSVNKQTTYAEAKAYKKQLLLPSNCDTIEFGFHYLGTQTDQFLYYDDIALSANQFLQVSTQLPTESYFAKLQTSFWYTSGGTSQWDETFLVPQGSPPLASSNLLTIVQDASRTIMKAKQDIVLTVNFTAYMSPSSGMNIYNSSAEDIGVQGNQAGSYNIYKQVSATINLAKDDYIYVTKASSGNTNGAVTITATPQVSSAVLLNSSESIFTDWTEYTPTFGGVSSTDHSIRWRRVGDTMEIEGTLVSSAVAVSPLYFELPSGYSIDSSKMRSNGGNVVGYGARVRNTLNPFNAGYDGLWFADPSSSSTRLYLTLAGSTSVSYATTNASGWGYVGDGLTISYVKVPIQGWNSSFNPVLSMPLVDFGTFDNTYGARIDLDSSAATLTSQSSSFISGVSRVNTGRVTITFTSGFFGVAPSITATPEFEENSDKYLNVYDITTTSFKVSIEAPTDYGFRDVPFNVTVTRQGSDWKQPPQATAAVIKPAVMCFSRRVAKNEQGGTCGAGSYTALEINYWEGESWFATKGTGTLGIDGTNVSVNLEPGMYEVNASQMTYTINGGFLMWNNYTDGTYHYGPQVYSNSTYSGAQCATIYHVFTITSTKEFRLYLYSVTEKITYGQGVALNVNAGPSSSAKEEIYLMGQIRKLK
jgi:hypothetical protein